MTMIELAERGWLPDWLIRIGIRRMLAKRLQSDAHRSTAAFAEQLRQSPLAVETEAANEQHYEVPVSFFQQVLGPRLKYSACLFPTPQATLADAEEEMLRKTCERAEIVNGMRILELGCGWGSLTLWLAEHYPQCKIVAVSNSNGQRLLIEEKARRNGFTNVQVITADMREFAIDQQFDRVVSVEMFEHMRNYALLLQRVSQWLAPHGKAFVHIFCHRNTPYLFETEGASNWMGRHFFTGGMMPSEQLFSQFAEDLTIEQQWRVSGLHYEWTCEAWLRNLDHRRDAILAIFRADMPDAEAKLRLQRWRIFFMACAELFGRRDGKEWFIAHYRFQPTGAPAPHRTPDRRSISNRSPNS